MGSNYKVKLYSVANENSPPELVSPFVCQTSDTYHDLRQRLESLGCLDWAFEFWDFDDQCRIRQKFEVMNPVTERVYVIPREDDNGGGAFKRQRLDMVEENASNDVDQQPSGEISDWNEDFICEAEPMPKDATAVELEDVVEVPNYLTSTLLSDEVMAKYNGAVLKLKKELANMDFADHLWNLKTYDLNGVGVVKIHCGECNKEFGGATGDHSKSIVANLFTNFKKSHLHSTLHIKQWCLRKKIQYNDHPKEGKKGKPVIYTAADHKKLVEESLSILKAVNDEVSELDPPFVVVGDVGVTELKSFWYKVRCKIDGELLLLCPPKKNLRVNLENHLHGFTHTKCLEAKCSMNKTSSPSATLSGKRGRPSTRSKATVGNQPDLHGWFRTPSLQSLGSINNDQAGKSDSILSMLCWGYWKRTTQYGGKYYKVDGMLGDPKPGSCWTAEPTTSC